MTACPEELLDTTLILDRSRLEGGGVYEIPATCPALPDDEEAGAAWFNDLRFPNFPLVYDTLPRSRWAKGSVLLSAVEDADTIPFSIIVTGTSQAALDIALDAIAETLAQETWEVSIAVGDVTYGPWQAWPTKYERPEPVSPRRAGMLAVQITGSITVQPPGAP